MADKALDKEKNTSGETRKSDFAAKAKGQSAVVLAELKRALTPRNIFKYLLSRLWKPALTFAVLFSLVLGGAYAGSYYKLFNAGTALNFADAMPALRASDNRAARELLPAAEWGVSLLAAAGEIIQYRVERQEALRIKEEEDKKAQKAEEERIAALEAEKQAADPKNARQEPQVKSNPEEEARKREAERKKEEDELKKTIAARQQELTKRAGKVALYYSAMPVADAVKILKKMENDEIILILSNMPDALASQILAGFEPDRASVITRNILKLHPTPAENAAIPSGVL